MASNACWGVEVGAGALKAIKLVRDGDGVAVADYAFIPHKRVLSTPDIDEKEARRLAVGAFVSQHDVTKASLAVSVAGHQSFARFAKLPPVEPKEIPNIVKFEAVQQIPFPIDEVQWDYQTFVSPDSPEVEVGIFAMTTERVMGKLAKWQDVGRVPEILTLSPLAAYNALSYDLNFSEQMPGTILLDIGTVATDLIVAEGGRLWIRTFPIGGHQFTEALATAFNLSYAKAEKLKRESETSQHARHILQAMRPVFGDLAADVQRSIGYYNSLHRDAKLSRVIGLGATFHLPGLRKFLSQQLSMEVTRLEAFQRIKMEGDRNTELQANAVSFATAYGLALQGLGMETIGANLMPVAVVREALWKRKTPWFVAAASVAMLAGGATFVRPLLDQAAIAGAQKPPVIDQAKAEANRLKSEWNQVTAKPDPRAASMLSLLERRQIMAHMVDDMGQILASAQQKAAAAGTKPVLVFRRFDPEFGGQRGGGATGGLDPIRGGPGLPAPAAPEAEGAAPALRIGCELEIQVAGLSESDAGQYVNQAVTRWLFDNANRPNLPYTIDTGRIRQVQRQVDKVGDPAADPAGRAPGGGAPPLGGRDGFGGGGGGDGGRGLIDPRRQREAGGPSPSGGPNPSGPVPGSARPPTSGPGFGPSGDGAADQVAPIPPAPPPAPPGATIITYLVTWDAVLKPEEKKGDGQ